MVDATELMEAGILGAIAAFVVRELATTLDYGTGVVETMVTVILPLLVAVAAVLGVLEASD